jgi:hypothetical protein
MLRWRWRIDRRLVRETHEDLGLMWLLLVSRG